MAKIIHDRLVLDANESEMLKQNLLHPDFEKLNEINKLYCCLDITTNDDGSWTVNCSDLIFDLTIQN